MVRVKTITTLYKLHAFTTNGIFYGINGIIYEANGITYAYVKPKGTKRMAKWLF
jgi:hypothetical protein